MVDTVIFDLDGTLLDTLEDLTYALNYSLDLFKYNHVNISDTRRFIGNGIRRLIEVASNDSDTNHLDLMFNRFKEYYTIHCNDYTKPYKGINEILFYLKNKNIKLGVVSNKAKYALEILVNSHFPNIFDVVIGDGEGLKRKPNPEPILKAIEKLNSNIANTIYIGDSDVDINTINNTGCHGIIVSFGYRDKEILIENNAMNLCDTVEELKEKLGDYFG